MLLSLETRSLPALVCFVLFDRCVLGRHSERYTLIYRFVNLPGGKECGS